MQPIKTINLEAEDLILYEDYLKKQLAELIDFTSGNVYFPQTLPSGLKTNKNTYQSVYVPEASKIFVPLVYKERLLGIFVAYGLDLTQPEIICPTLNKYAQLCLENILLKKRTKYDHLTGLLNKENFLARLINEIENISCSFFTGRSITLDYNVANYKSHFCLIILNVDRMKRINRIYGYQIGDQVLYTIANSINKFCPNQATTGKLANDSLAILFPNIGSVNCRNFTEKLKKELDSLVFEHPATEEKFKVSTSMGFSNYPQNMYESHCHSPAYEQAHILIENCFRALKVSKQAGGNQIVSYLDILSYGGTMLSNISMNKVSVNLGSLHQAREGQHFFVYANSSQLNHNMCQDDSSRLKGEIVLVDVQAEESIAEILYINEPKQNLTPGDRLIYQPQPDESLEQKELYQEAQYEDLMNNVLPYPKFLRAWQDLRRKDFQFTLMFCSLHTNSLVSIYQSLEHKNKYYESLKLIRQSLPKKTIIGQLGLNCFLVYISNQTSEETLPIAKDIYQQLKQNLSLTLAIGLADYPCLNYKRADILINCRKALKHAQLLKEQPIASFDSLSLTISADQYFNQNDLANAIEEYKAALLFDQNNAIARNSLGICYARLGEFGHAFQEFERIVDLEPQNDIALYNLGYASLKLGEKDLAESAFEKCLRLNPKQPLYLIRLGQLAEEKNDLVRAREFYNQATQVTGGEKYAYHSLAKLDNKEGKIEDERKHLHQTLIYNPQDAEALCMLAKLYLQQGENAEIAENLVKKSICLRPDVKEYFEVLEQAIQDQGKEEKIPFLQARYGNIYFD